MHADIVSKATEWAEIEQRVFDCVCLCVIVYEVVACVRAMRSIIVCARVWLELTQAVLSYVLR